MPNKSNRRSSRTTGRSMRAQMQELINLNKQQTIKENPEAMDVEWPIIKRHKIHTFTRKQNFGTITASVTTEQDGAFAFSLASLPDPTEFTNLYDVYRISKVKLDFYPLFIDTSATVPYPPIITAIDYDDNVATSYSILQEYNTSLVSQTGTFFSRVLTPRVALAAYGGAFTQFAQAHADQWLDCASPGVTHYGLKYALPIAGAANGVWLVEATYLIQFRENR